MNIEHKFESLKQIKKNISRETFENLILFEQELLKWNNKINLIGSGTKDKIWQRHILDCVQIDEYLENYNKIIDLGSGGGLPGLVLAILNKNKQNFAIDLIEKDQKKCVFLQNIVAKLKLPAVIQNNRIEDYKIIYKGTLAITSRAFASLSTIFRLTEEFSKHNNIVAFLQKGQNYELEVEEASKNWQFSMDIYNSKLQEHSVILNINNITKYKKENLNE